MYEHVVVAQRRPDRPAPTAYWCAKNCVIVGMVAALVTGPLLWYYR